MHPIQLCHPGIPLKGEYTDQQGDHEFRGEPDMRIAEEVVADPMRTETDEAGGGLGQVLLAVVTLLATLDPVLLIHS